MSLRFILRYDGLLCCVRMSFDCLANLLFLVVVAHFPLVALCAKDEPLRFSETIVDPTIFVALLFPPPLWPHVLAQAGRLLRGTFLPKCLLSHPCRVPTQQSPTEPSGFFQVG